MRRLSIYIVLLIGLANTLMGQVGANQEVKVVKPYEPVISDAFKLSELPKITDTLKVAPEFNYEITPSKYETTFEPKSIKPAKLISEPLSKLYYGYARVGFGTYLSPLAEISAGSKRSEKWLWHSKLNYNSSNGKVKNEAGEKVYAGLSNFGVSGSGTHFFENKTDFTFSASYKNKSSYYYGYNPDVIDSILEAPLLKKEIEKQTLNTIYVGGNYKSNHTDSLFVNHNTYINWKGTTTKSSASENDINIGTNINYFFERQYVGVNANIRVFNNKGFETDYNYGLVDFNPWIGAFGDKYRVIVGVNTSYKTDSSDYHFYPRVSLHYNIIDFFLIPYVEINGDYQMHTYNSIFNENNFVKTDLIVSPTNNKYDISAGFRGNISSKIAFNLRVNYGRFNDQYFYVNDTSISLQNKFGVTYDDMTKVRFLGEISYKNSDRLFLSLKGNYYKYELDNELYAWHLPEYEISLNARYSIQDKIIADVNVFSIGKRFAKEFNSDGSINPIELEGIVDLNVGIEYRYSKILAAFVKLNNIAGMKYYKWNHYPTQQFNLMLGVSYSF